MATDASSSFLGAGDPFAQLDGGSTIIRPNPGGWQAAGAASASAAAAGLPALEWPRHGLNPLLALANHLLLAVPQIRGTRHLPDPATLKTALAQALRDFSVEAAKQGVSPQNAMAARYVLCTLLDEAAGDTPWGASGVWAQHSLLVLFHNEAWGGEKVFQLMTKLAAQPAQHLDLLELIYVAMTMGFEGRFRTLDNGQAQLAAVRDKLGLILLQSREPHPVALSAHWQGSPTHGRRFGNWLTLAVVASCAMLLLGGGYVGFSYALNDRTDAVYGDIQSLRLPAPVAAVVQPSFEPRLAQYLRADIGAGLLAVRDEVDRSVVTLRGDGLFDPGSAALVQGKEVLLGRVADALAKIPGRVLVTGHTDSQPIRSPRFPSNWHLSEERAKTVTDLLISRGVGATRIDAEGRADGEPLVANDTAIHRAMNRRVEVTLFVGPRQDNAAPPSPGSTPTAQSGSRS